jgi:serine/threonine protein kinase
MPTASNAGKIPSVGVAPVVLPPAVPAAIPLPPAPPPTVPPVPVAAGVGRKVESDEYAPNETAEMKRRTAALTNRQFAVAAAVDVDPSQVPAALPVAGGTDPFDPDLFERMARQAQVDRTRKENMSAGAGPVRQEPPATAMDSAPAATTVPTAPLKDRTVTARRITCPVCGHGFSSTVPDDLPQSCPQCQTSFNLARGHVVSGGAKGNGGDPLLGRLLRGCLIDRKVGEGGMGSVYHARQLSLERSVAIKVLPPELARNRNFISRFEREAKSLARINHPNILHIYDFGEDQQLGIYFMIIEFVEGRDLGDLLHESYTLGQIELLDILRQAAMGLEQAAEKGVIHRDIKPDNLMLTKEGICKVSDFGLAKATTAEKDVTTVGVRVGTPAFMSPEQCDGDDVDFRSDIYNLGCTAFLALTGQLPYDADTPFAIMLKHKNDPVPSPRSFNPNLDSRVERLVMRMIAKRPSDRFDTLRELVEQVEDLEVKLAGTSTVLRKTRGPFRAMNDLEAVEHARMTSSGIRAATTAERPIESSADQKISRRSATVPVAKPASTPAPVGESMVPDWLKPVEEAKPRKTTSNLHPMPTPKPAPQAGTTSQREMKDLRSKLTEARQRNLQEESQALVAEGDRFAANGQMSAAADAWTRAATMTPNAAEAQSLLQRANKARRGRGIGRLIKRLVILVLVLGLIVAAAFYGVPVGHNLIANQKLEPLRSISAPQSRLTALEGFVATYGTPLEAYAQVFNQSYPIIAADTARAEIAQIKLQLAPPPPKVDPAKPSKADQEMTRLEALRADVAVPWMTVAAEARRVIAEGEAKERARPILSEAEQQLAAMASDYEEIRTQWTDGRQGVVAELAAKFRAKHQRAGASAPSALPGRVVVVDADTGVAPAQVHIVTRVQVAEGGDRGVLGGESRLPAGETSFCRYPRSTVTLEISAPKYRTERIQVPANADPAELTVTVALHPGEAWRAQVARQPRWLSLNSLPGSPYALLRTPEHLALVRLATGELRSSLTRSQASVPAANEGALWTDCLDPRGTGFTVGTTDGLGVELLVDDATIRLGKVLHRGKAPLLAFIDKDLTFQAKRAFFAVSAVDKGMTLSARTSDKDLWLVDNLTGFQRPWLWSQDDRVLVIDDRQIRMFDEAEGKQLVSHAFPGIRSGAPARLSEGTVLVVPTAAGAALLRVAVAGSGSVTELEDMVLVESRARLVAQDANVVLTAGQDRSLRLITWNGSGFSANWSAVLPADAGQATWLSLQTDHAVVGDDRGVVFLLARADGKLQRRIQHASQLLMPPVVSDGQLVVGDRDGNLIGYHLP